MDIRNTWTISDRNYENFLLGNKREIATMRWMVQGWFWVSQLKFRTFLISEVNSEVIIKF